MDTTPTRARQDVLTLAEAAGLLRCSRPYLRKLLSGGMPDIPPLPVLRLSRVLIRREALEQWLLKLERREREAQQAGGSFARWLDDNDFESIAGA